MGFIDGHKIEVLEDMEYKLVIGWCTTRQMKKYIYEVIINSRKKIRLYKKEGVVTVHYLASSS